MIVETAVTAWLFTNWPQLSGMLVLVALYWKYVRTITVKVARNDKLTKLLLASHMRNHPNQEETAEIIKILRDEE